MQSMSTNTAKTRFGQLLDTARREPVMIEKHGRPVVVVLSAEDYEELEAIKLERLRAEVQIGLDEIERGEVIDVDEAGLHELIEEIKTEGRKTAQ